jgi:diguanylate cyclase (GGDEF)-like protein/PAS domain S-box-containing protein
VRAPLSDSAELFRDLFDNAPVGYHEVDATGRLVRVNQTELSMLGYEAEEMIGRFAWEFVVEKISRAAFAAKIAKTLPLAPFERTFRRKDGTHLPVMLEERLLHDESGKACGIRTTVFDITAKKQAEQALRESEARYRQLVELSPDAILVQYEGRFVFVNSAAVQLFRAEKAEDLLERRAMDLVPPELLDVDRAPQQRIADDRMVVPLIEQKIKRVDGSGVDVEVAAMPFSYEGKPAIQVVIRDITLRKLADEQIRSLAYHDALTGLPNRILFNDRVAMAVAQAHRQKHKVGLLFIDLDRFKAINDSLGHTMGDKLLRAVAKRIQSCVREGDTVSRRGGDEFTLLLPGLQQATDAARAAEKVLDALRLPFMLEGRELFVTASVGISLYPDDGLDCEVLLKNSDVAMYRAKEKGRDNYQLYGAGMNARALERLSLEHSLPKALSRNELVVVYQPVIRLEDFTIESFEALLRWQHPELGLLLPRDFIAVAEMMGLIVPIGAWVLRAACAQVRAWQLLGYRDLSVSVNLSPRQFQHARLADDVHAALQKSGLDASFLDLEIKEANAMENAELTLSILRRLTALGVGIAIDDFGAGYSSVIQLKRLRARTIKIDSSIVSAASQDIEQASIAAALSAMAHELGLRVVAKGVENAEQLALLRGQSCDAVQGLFFSQPLLAEHCETLLSSPGLVITPLDSGKGGDFSAHSGNEAKSLHRNADSSVPPIR